MVESLELILNSRLALTPVIFPQPGQKVSDSVSSAAHLVQITGIPPLKSNWVQFSEVVRICTLFANLPRFLANYLFYSIRLLT